jgi:DNA-binding response OmpR family regulator
VIDVHVSNLRRKLGNERIKTVRGAGYLFVVRAAARHG